MYDYRLCANMAEDSDQGNHLAGWTPTASFDLELRHDIGFDQASLSTKPRQPQRTGRTGVISP